MDRYLPNTYAILGVYSVKNCTVVNGAERALSVKVKHEYLRSRASTCMSLSSSSDSDISLKKAHFYRDTHAYILDLASTNFVIDASVQA